MKLFRFIVIFLFWHTAVNAASCPESLSFSFPKLQDDSPQSLCQYAEKVLLIVNTASYCGYTNQYKGLEELNRKYAGKGLVVLGFPSNDFSKQEPGSSKEIAEFCKNTFGVKFPMFAKSSVKGSQANPLYQQLIKATGQEPQWNFHKYLINRQGKVVASYTSETAPDDKKLLNDIQTALAAPVHQGSK
jgi:glutathione peroxidase